MAAIRLRVVAWVALTRLTSGDVTKQGHGSQLKAPCKVTFNQQDPIFSTLSFQAAEDDDMTGAQPLEV